VAQPPPTPALLGADGDAVTRAHVLAVLAFVLVLRGRTARAAEAHCR
jgi:hypothetical protein